MQYNKMTSDGKQLCVKVPSFANQVLHFVF